MGRRSHNRAGFNWLATRALPGPKNASDKYSKAVLRISVITLIRTDTTLAARGDARDASRPVRTPRNGHLSQKADCVGKNPIIAISGACELTKGERFVETVERGGGRLIPFSEFWSVRGPDPRPRVKLRSPQTRPLWTHASKLPRTTPPDHHCATCEPTERAQRLAKLHTRQHKAASDFTTPPARDRAVPNTTRCGSHR